MPEDALNANAANRAAAIRMQRLCVFESYYITSVIDRIRNLLAVSSEIKSRTALYTPPEPMTNVKVMKFKGRKKKDLTNQTNDWLDLEVII
jgi:hypothetical protein